jgi:hypothetical protein
MHPSKLKEEDMSVLWKYWTYGEGMLQEERIFRGEGKMP